MKPAKERHGTRIANAIIIPMFAVVLIAVAITFGLLIWSAHISDQAAEKSQRQLLTGTLQLTRDQFARQQASVLVKDPIYYITTGPIYDTSWLYHNVALWLKENYGFSRTLLLDQEGKYRFVDGPNVYEKWVTRNLLNSLQPAVRAVQKRYLASLKELPSGLFYFDPDYRINEHTLSETGLVSIKGNIYLFSVAAITPELMKLVSRRTTPAILVNFKQLNGELLAEIGRVSALEGMVLDSIPALEPGGPSIDLKAPDGTTIGHIHWQAEQPGQEMQSRITPVLAVLALALVGLSVVVMAFIRQSTRHLASSRADAVRASLHDPLSGLPNRRQFKQLLVRTLDDPQVVKRGAAVLYFDLDRFKDINDTLGHAAGDWVICAIAERLRRVLPENGIVARISGDEFALLLPDCPNEAQAEQIMSRLQDMMVQPVSFGPDEIHVSVSMGAALAPRDGLEAEELLRKADIALYDAKSNGRNRWSFFEPSMQEHVRTKDEIARELRKAVDEDLLDVAYQPQCDSRSDKVVAIEALARWNRPNTGAVPPASFIPVAEETGLINDLGLWILRRACRDAHRWPGIIVSVNVSPTQFKHPRFVDKVIATLEEFDLDPERLEIEVTETVFAGRDKKTLQSLKRLKDLGIKIALDDFGSGYSSLSYLRHFPFDTLKIDQDFISAMNDSPEARAIVRTIIRLGQALGMTIVAEGIEEKQQAEYLAANGCHRLQGYFISHPLPAKDLDEFLADHEIQVEMKHQSLEVERLRSAEY
ncbi:putative bifunctional diguanylate cyclase/phosphodiesterase [Roseibium aggregatum]|uniref:Bifunctional diguanylate cyclase/phosphodiesterase n=1 Tax=Roseibium aggregatum TaxID=187304 RepID=A0A926P2N0_9HYPH|nr:bifunctional diguanylate cyclase/phosphodiesterase [Roseibium aggregatum]MBD1547978.1 bifunctional diguanylate cyclase/phosphodiesterase [Roseibium aggregatum]